MGTVHTGQTNYIESRLIEPRNNIDLCSLICGLGDFRCPQIAKLFPPIQMYSHIGRGKGRTWPDFSRNISVRSRRYTGPKAGF